MTGIEHIIATRKGANKMTSTEKKELVEKFSEWQSEHFEHDLKRFKGFNAEGEKKGWFAKYGGVPTPEIEQMFFNFATGYLMGRMDDIYGDD
jgi:hypothetical protein